VCQVQKTIIGVLGLKSRVVTPALSITGLFSWVTCHFKNWSIFIGDMPFLRFKNLLNFIKDFFSKKIQKYLCNALGFHGMHVSLPALKYPFFYAPSS
jgi:hypothetical protein